MRQGGQLKPVPLVSFFSLGELTCYPGNDIIELEKI